MIVYERKRKTIYLINHQQKLEIQQQSRAPTDSNLSPFWSFQLGSTVNNLSTLSPFIFFSNLVALLACLSIFRVFLPVPHMVSISMREMTLSLTVSKAGSLWSYMGK